MAAGRDDEASPLLARAKPIATRYGLLEELAITCCLQGNLLLSTADFEACLSQQVKARLFAEKAGSLEWEVRAVGGLGDAYCLGGRMQAAFSHFDRCIALSRDHGFDAIAVAHLAMRGWTRLYKNQVDAAARDCAQGAEEAELMGNRRAESNARHWLSLIMAETGHFDDARREIERARSIARELSVEHLRIGLVVSYCKIMAMQGQRVEARSVLQKALADCEVGDLLFAGPMAFGALAVLTDDPDERAIALADGAGLLLEGAAGYNALFFYRDAMDAALLDRNPDSVERHADALDRFIAPDPTPWGQFFVNRGRTLAAFWRGQRDAANRHERFRLCDEAKQAGLHVAARALDDPLGDARAILGFPASAHEKNAPELD